MSGSDDKPPLGILYADDGECERALFGFAAAALKLEVWLQTVAGGEQVVGYLEGKGEYANQSLYPLPDLLVLDLRMPGMDGFDVLRWRRASREFASLPVVALSGTMFEDDLDLALELGAQAAFRKPLGFAEWQRVVREIYECGLKSIRERQ